MTFKTKLFSAILSAFAVLTFSTFVSAQDVKPETQPETTQKQERRMKMGKRDGLGKRDGYRNKKRGGFMRGLQALNLSEDQKTQIRTIMDGNKNAYRANREEMKTIVQAKRDGTITPEQQEKLNAFKAQMKEDAKKTHEQVLGILTPEQRAQYEKNKEEMKRKREERRQLRDQNPQTTTEKKDNDN